MKVKKILKIVLIVLSVFYVLRSPNSAAETLRTAWSVAMASFDALLKR